MLPYFSHIFANPSSIHRFGNKARDNIQQVRHQIAKKINCKIDEIIFTSSGTESNNFCLKGYAFANKAKGNHIITSTIEHASVLNTCAFLEKHGFDITYLEVDSQGFVAPHSLEEKITDKTLLISIAHVNNEIGTIQPIEELVKVSRGITFHTDAVQSFLKTNFDVQQLNIGLASFSGHKFHAPKGIGFIYKRSDIALEPLIHGGHQEMNLRPGTENVPYIMGLGKAIESIGEKEIFLMKELQKYFLEEIAQFPGTRINGPEDLNKRICTNLNISCDCFEGEFVLQELAKLGCYVSTGSACQSSHSRISHVLQAIKCPPRFIHGNIRIGLSKFTRKSDIQNFLDYFSSIISTKSPFKLYLYA